MSALTTSSRVRRSAAVLIAAGGLSVAAAVPASAAPTNNQRGLVNANLQNINVQVPVAVAADICGVAVNVLAQQVGQGPIDCTANGDATATRNPGGGDANNRQRGLVNVNIQNVNAQIPIAVAANVCGVTVNVLANAITGGAVSCDANGISTATA